MIFVTSYETTLAEMTARKCAIEGSWYIGNE